MAALSAVLAACLLILGPRRVAAPPRTARERPDRRLGRWATGIGAGLAAWFVIGGVIGSVAGVAAAAAAWVTLTRSEPSPLRREREAAVRDLPHLVELLGATLRAGAEPVAGLRLVCHAMPGPAARRLVPVLAHADLGEVDAWRVIADDEVLGPLGRTLARSARTGSPVVGAVERLADELEAEAAAVMEDRARRVGVAAALPLGVCLLPGFMLLGIVPTVAAMLSSITD